MIKHLFIGYPVKKADSEEHSHLTVSAVAIVSSVMVSGFIIINYLKGHHTLAAVESLSLLLFILCITPFFKHKVMLRQNMIVAASSILLMALLVDGGIAKVAIFWSLLIPFIACLFLGLPKAWYWIGAYGLGIGIVFALHLYWRPFLPYDHSLLVYFPFCFIQFSFLAAILQSQFEWSELKYQKSINELNELSKHLEDKVLKRTEDLALMNENLKKEMKQHDETVKALHESEIQVYQMQKMETIGTLVGGIAHDFNNMLAGINANIFMIKRKVTDDPDLLKRTKDIESLVMSASDMIRQLLTFAKKDHVAFEPFDLVAFIKESFGLVKVAISEHVHMSLDIQQNSLPVFANKTQIQQVIMNMVNNARDASLHAKQPTIRVQVKHFTPNEGFKKEHPTLQDREYARITIADNGSGIPEEQLSKIFEPFLQPKKLVKVQG
jgi:signal transduction histidine kinase